MEGVSEGEGVSSRLKLRLHGTVEIPRIFIRSVLRILVYAQDLTIDVEDDVLMILILVTRGITGTAAVGMALHHPTQKLNTSAHIKIKGVGV
jgi:hypothetical protein